MKKRLTFLLAALASAKSFGAGRGGTHQQWQQQQKKRATQRASTQESHKVEDGKGATHPKPKPLTFEDTFEARRNDLFANFSSRTSTTNQKLEALKHLNLELMERNDPHFFDRVIPDATQTLQEVFDQSFPNATLQTTNKCVEELRRAAQRIDKGEVGFFNNVENLPARTLNWENMQPFPKPEVGTIKNLNTHEKLLDARLAEGPLYFNQSAKTLLRMAVFLANYTHSGTEGLVVALGITGDLTQGSSTPSAIYNELFRFTWDGVTNDNVKTRANGQSQARQNRLDPEQIAPGLLREAILKKFRLQAKLLMPDDVTEKPILSRDERQALENAIRNRKIALGKNPNNHPELLEDLIRIQAIGTQQSCNRRSSVDQDFQEAIRRSTASGNETLRGAVGGFDPEARGQRGDTEVQRKAGTAAAARHDQATQHKKNQEQRLRAKTGFMFRNSPKNDAFEDHTQQGPNGADDHLLGAVGGFDPNAQSHVAPRSDTALDAAIAASLASKQEEDEKRAEERKEEIVRKAKQPSVVRLLLTSEAQKASLAEEQRLAEEKASLAEVRRLAEEASLAEVRRLAEEEASLAEALRLHAEEEASLAEALRLHAEEEASRDLIQQYKAQEKQAETDRAIAQRLAKQR